LNQSEPIIENENSIIEIPVVDVVSPANQEEVVEKKKSRSLELSRLRPSQGTIIGLAVILLTVLTSYLYQYFLSLIK